MVYDKESGKGIKKKWLPDPNPRKVEMARSCSLVELFNKGKDIYFHPDTCIDELKLGDSRGMSIQIVVRRGL